LHGRAFAFSPGCNCFGEWLSLVAAAGITLLSRLSRAEKAENCLPLSKGDALPARRRML
jgi:hypothetical protein